MCLQVALLYNAYSPSSASVAPAGSYPAFRMEEGQNMRRMYPLALGVAVFMLSPLTADEKGKDEAKLDPAKLVGTWNYVSGERDGKKVPEDNLKKGTVEITKNTISLKGADATYVMKYVLDSAKSPCQISIEITEGPQGVGVKTEGIIALKGNELQLCYPPMGGDAPKEFKSKEGSNLHLFVLKRKK
jgi:uncharacterized protein (TIGR03067 family)